MVRSHLTLSGFSSANTHKTEPDQFGFSLLIVLWFLVLFAGISLHLVSVSRSDIKTARQIVAAASADCAADAALAQTIFALSDPDPSKRWPLDGASHSIIIPNGRAIAAATDESGKINPNLAAPELIAALFATLGENEIAAKQAAEAIIAWRQPVNENDAALQSTTSELSLPPIAALDELRQIPNLSPLLLIHAMPYFSLYVPNPEPLYASAPPVVRAALKRYRGATTQPLDIVHLTGGKPAILAAIVVEAKTADGMALARRQAIVRIDLRPQSGFVVLGWSRA